MRRWLPLLIALAALVAAAAPRLDEGLWSDEVASTDVASRDVPTLLLTAGLSDVHPPLYYLALKAWTGLGGAGDVWVRLLSLLCALGTLLVLHGWARRRHGEWPAALAVLALATSTFFVHYAVEARGYALLTLLATGCLATYDRWLSAPADKRRLALLVALQIGAALTHYYGLLIVALLNVHLFAATRPDDDALRRWATAQLAVLAGIAWWSPLTFVQLFDLPAGFTAHLAHPPPVTEVVAAFGPATSVAWPAVAVAVGAGALGLAGWGAWRTRRPAPRLAAADQTTQPAVVVGLLVLLFALPLLPLLLPHSETTLDLVAGRIGEACGVLAGAVVALGGAVVLRRRLAVALPLDTAALVLVGAAVVIGLSLLLRPTLSLRNLLLLLPLVALLAAAAVARGPRSAAATAVIVVALAAASLVRAPERFAPRQDLEGAAAHIARAPGPVTIIPAWDASGLAHYLDGAAPVVGVMSPSELSATPARTWVVLTRDARADPRFAAAFGAALRPRSEVARVVLRGILLLRFE